MSEPFSVKPSQKAVKTYYEALAKYAGQRVEHETALRSAFQNLLEQTGRRFGWTLIPELSDKTDGRRIQPDATFRDDFEIKRGFWEAKDTHDDLEAEIQKKIKRGYPLSNTIFEDTRTAFLFQNGRQAMKVDLTDRRQLCDLLNAFFGHVEPAHEDFGKAIDEFKERVPELARGLVRKIEEAHEGNAKFQEAFEQFFDLCKASLNPNLSRAAVDEMLVQHLLTERLIRTIFDNQDFTRRNVIAAEVEKVIDALVSRSFDRHAFLKSLDRFYVAIEGAAGTIDSFTEKQHFLNVIYERFFQGYSVKVADTHGIVYTPQEIVDFMCASVAEVLEHEFGKKLGDPGVLILDPCTGTGNFIVNLMGRIPKRHLPRMYREQLFANEVMLMPYYIAALNIEHAYYEKTGEYEPFEGMCFVDTLDLAEAQQKTFGFMTESNTERVEREKNAPITVVIGNPPYNVGQLNENDNNKNRLYPVVEGRVHDTYAKRSRASNKNALSDAYVKFFRWGTDRLGSRNGILCFVSNNAFISGVAFDGFREEMLKDYTAVYHFDLKGNARTTGERRRREAGNIFSDMIRVGVGITLLARTGAEREKQVNYYAVGDYLKCEKKRRNLASFACVAQVPWQKLVPDEANNWVSLGTSSGFSGLLPMGSRLEKGTGTASPNAVFGTFGRGLATCRDSVVYDCRYSTLRERTARFINDYNAEVDRFRRASPKPNVDDFVHYETIKWSRDLKADLARERYAQFSDAKIRTALYRPFYRRFVFFDRILNEEVYLFARIFPTIESEGENLAVAITDRGSEWPFAILVSRFICDLHFVGVGANSSQCFPFYTYEEDGSNRRENITDWALKNFRDHYGNRRMTKWDIFYYVYGLLHHPGYRERYAENLKRELPRIPLAPDFRAFSQAGTDLARLHLDYEELEPYELEWVETEDVPLSYRVEKMRLSRDKRSLHVNDSLTLGGIPPEVFEYRLGNRSALEWVIDQYRVKTDKRSGITSDPNCADDPEYIVRLVGQVVRVSLETVRIVKSLPEDFGAPKS